MNGGANLEARAPGNPLPLVWRGLLVDSLSFGTCVRSGAGRREVG